MQSVLEKIIQYDSESPTLDFKEIQYSLENNPKKNELLKDISAMANYPGDENRFIIIGVIESNGVAGKFRDIDQLIDDAKYQQFLMSNIEPKINFEYKPFSYKGHQLAYFRIFNCNERPYLFKKDLISPVVADRIDYKSGDGFIRVGTSTKKLTRDDFERIYSHRYSKQDRSGDLGISIYVERSSDDELNYLGLDCIEIEVKNNSAKSVDFDVQMKIFKVEGLDIVPENVLQKQIEEQRHEEQKRKNPYSMILPTALGFSMDVSISDEEGFFLVTRDKRRGDRTAVSIPQNDSYRNVFCCNAIILTEKTVSLKGEIIIRCDDFVRGALVKTFDMNYTPNRSNESANMTSY
jgi:hypothetical protein